jgi:hypothetical protein
MSASGAFTTNVNDNATNIAKISRRIAIKNDVEPEDWQDIYERIDSSAKRFPISLFHLTVGAGTLAGLFGTVSVFMVVLTQFFPFVAPSLLACFISPLGFLVGAAGGQLGGNLFFQLWLGLDRETRRGFATRLTLARAPEEWALQVKKWLFTGDWMNSPVYDARLPYVRIFVSGDAPVSCAEEDRLWREIHDKVSGDSLWEAGANHREISYPMHLPAWARKVETGDGVEELDKRLGSDVSHAWVRHLWRRACRQWPLLGSGEFPLNARKETFEAHHLFLQHGREALLVVLRPNCFAAEVGEEEVAEHKEIVAA